jgi:hypothetical protein
MITDQSISKFYEDVELLGLKFPVADISKATGWSKGNVSQYLKKGGSPSQNFLDAFYREFGESIKKVPREKQQESGGSHTGDQNNSPGITFLAINDIAKSNVILAEANRTLADAHKILAKNNEDLIFIMKESKTPLSPSKNLLNEPATFGALLEVLAEIGSGKKWHSKDEALAEVGRRLVVKTKQSNRRTDIHAGGGKKRTVKA